MEKDDFKDFLDASNLLTLDYFTNQWLRNTKEAKRRFGSFKENGVGKLHGINAGKPAIIIGAGPSLEKNAKELKRAKAQGITTLACLHCYPYLHDLGIDIDYYVAVDAVWSQELVISDGGKLTHEEYLASTKDKTLLAATWIHPLLFESWQGKVLLFNAPQDRGPFDAAVQEIEPFNTNVSCGTTVLGAAFYIAKMIMGSNPICFVGADFAMRADGNQYCWDYDPKICVNTRDKPKMHVDIYGNAIPTTYGYYYMKHWFDNICIKTPGIYINCTEGGILGSYPEGNIASIQQMKLKDFFKMYRLHHVTKSQCENPEKPDIRVLFG